MRSPLCNCRTGEGLSSSIKCGIVAELLGPSFYMLNDSGGVEITNSEIQNLSFDLGMNGINLLKRTPFDIYVIPGDGICPAKFKTQLVNFNPLRPSFFTRNDGKPTEFNHWLAQDDLQISQTIQDEYRAQYDPKLDSEGMPVSGPWVRSLSGLFGILKAHNSELLEQFRKISLPNLTTEARMLTNNFISISYHIGDLNEFSKLQIAGEPFGQKLAQFLFELDEEFFDQFHSRYDLTDTVLQLTNINEGIDEAKEASKKWYKFSIGSMRIERILERIKIILDKVDIRTTEPWTQTISDLHEALGFFTKEKVRQRPEDSEWRHLFIHNAVVDEHTTPETMSEWSEEYLETHWLTSGGASSLRPYRSDPNDQTPLDPLEPEKWTLDHCLVPDYQFLIRSRVDRRRWLNDWMSLWTKFIRAVDNAVSDMDDIAYKPPFISGVLRAVLRQAGKHSKTGNASAMKVTITDDQFATEIYRAVCWQIMHADYCDHDSFSAFRTALQTFSQVYTAQITSAIDRYGGDISRINKIKEIVAVNGYGDVSRLLRSPELRIKSPTEIPKPTQIRRWVSGALNSIRKK